ncbi:Nucleoside-diphosphate-sugar epimerase [Meinhardsimonia xiamenensis]|jgi:nucleoside-diphosphate-sugar epimerase|uniref:Nucleoside-diphosphate-sugar epimerase n=1 Tax=Meinhardsimonia xiamenensis TaxID=990712 RepID=A0A1G9B220_9RHOB|nr:NAD(P)-dependent oxidoreductase [Meinhardsimonia xiamenensis]PRX35152.1 nucleoside-diphosphate-sugar epimerase [Meinhardsimonia xiamenensis]SDK33619.1 Nucleoside-diphosphate-sugar epimerase [Meinhardsimonia xiamenensis]
MRLAVTGGTGLVGRFIVEAALAAGHEVVLLAPSPPPEGFFSAPVEWRAWRLGKAPGLEGCDGLVHAALAHLPGRYRGGEGSDPEGFARLNLDGTLRLFAAAEGAGVKRALFLSSRAVFDGYPPGTRLAPELPPRPTTLYGRVKAQAEARLAALVAPGFAVASLRATGVYGPAGSGRRNKWAGLFADYLAGRPIAPRVGSEVHGADLARAALMLIERGARGPWHVSDIVLDRRDLLARVARLTGCRHPLPEAADASALSLLDCATTRALGWRPGGMARLEASLPGLIAAA